MKPHRTLTKTLVLAAFLVSITFGQQALAAAKASDIDPSRFKIGNVVYPPGHKPSEEERAAIEARSGKGKSKAVTISPTGKPKHPAKSKGQAGD